MTRVDAIVSYLASLGVELSPEKRERIAKILADNDRDKPKERQPRGRVIRSPKPDEPAL